MYKNMTWSQKQTLHPKIIRAETDCLPEEAGYDSGRFTALNRHLQSLIQRKIILSGSYCLGNEQSIFADNALGLTADGRPFEPDTPYEIQSITKAITAAAVLKLTEDGLLWLDQPVSEIISEFGKEPFCRITLLHLLTHTSGLSPFRGVFPEVSSDWETRADTADTKDGWIPAILQDGLYSPPGEQWVYSLAGYAVLGEIITRVSGVKAEDYIRNEILLPCDMTNAHWHCEKEHASRAFPPLRKEIPETANGLTATSRELAHFGQMLLNNGTYKGNRVIGRKTVEYLFINLVGSHVKDYCWGHPGWQVDYGAGMPILRQENDRQQLVSNGTVYHEGTGACMLMIDRKEHLTAVWFTPFADKEAWNIEAVKNTASVIWSGII